MLLLKNCNHHFQSITIPTVLLHPTSSTTASENCISGSNSSIISKNMQRGDYKGDLIHSNSDDDESDYYDADEENSVDTQPNALFLQGSLHPMNISSSSRSYKNPLVVSEESNAEILDSFSWNYSGFLQWVPIEKVQSWFTRRNLFYVAILIALKIGIFLIFGYMLFGSTIDEEKLEVNMNVLNSDLIPWSTTFRKTDILRDLISATTEKSKSSSVLLSTPISWTYAKDVMEVRFLRTLSVTIPNHWIRSLYCALQNLKQ